MFLLRRQRILQIKIHNALLVRHHHIVIVRYPLCHPVMTADGFQPPDLVPILKCDAVHLVSDILFQQAAQTRHALSGGVDIRKHQINDVLLADAAGHLFPAIRGRLILHQRICPQHPGIGGDRLRRRHAHMGCVHAAGRPHALSFQHIGHGGIAHGILRQIDLHMRNHRFIFSRLLLRVHHHEFLWCKMTGAGVIIAGNDGGAVIRCFFADQYCCTGHFVLLLFFSFICSVLYHICSPQYSLYNRPQFQPKFHPVYLSDNVHINTVWKMRSDTQGSTPFSTASFLLKNIMPPLL